MQLSVIICAHNPRDDYLKRALERLEQQTLPKDQWELLLVDNASDSPLAGRWDLKWHPAGRHISEMELGLTPARLHGLREARGRLRVFVDDDNLLAPDYLETCVSISVQHPNLGAFGGRVIAEFEDPPQPWVLRNQHFLANREVDTDCWSNDPHHWEALPFGAGLCIRESITDCYLKLLKEEPLRIRLDRIGDQVLGGGDIDMVRTCCRLGMGFGRFRSLRVDHLINRNRTTIGYMRRLVFGSAASYMLLEYFDGRASPTGGFHFGQWLRMFLSRTRLSRNDWLLCRAEYAGRRDAPDIYREICADHGSADIGSCSLAAAHKTH